MARRCALWSGGMQISKAGIDALDPGIEDNLLFSMGRKSLMQIGAGSFFLTSGMRINFGITTPDAPLVFCQAQNQAPLRPVQWQADTTGFYIWATTKPNGSIPAEGAGVYWAAFMRSQG